jgi:hypothetical protein
MNPRVVSVKPGKNYTLEISFTNGELKSYDVKPLLNTGLFKELKNPALFNSVRPVMGSIQWENGLDLCPDTLYLDSINTSTLQTKNEWPHKIMAEGQAEYHRSPEKTED